MTLTAVEVLAAAFLLAGSFFSVVGGIGLLRLPDFYTRMHGAGITDTMGAGLVLVGLMLYAGPTLITVKLVMILFLLWITSPTSGHALARAALRQGVEPVVVDQEDKPSAS